MRWLYVKITLSVVSSSCSSNLILVASAVAYPMFSTLSR